MELLLEETALEGSTICRGIAIGKPFFLKQNESFVFEVHLAKTQTKKEVERYRSALAISRKDLKKLQKQLETESAYEGAHILEAQIEMLNDPTLTTGVENGIQQQLRNAEFVLKQVLDTLKLKFQEIEDPFFAERFMDLKDLTRRIFCNLQDNKKLSLGQVPPGSIVCAKELTATDVASAHHSNVAAFLTESGGATSHAAIIAKAKGIPFITNIGLIDLDEKIAELLIVDGRTGRVLLNPTEKSLKYYASLQNKISEQTLVFEKIVKQPAQTYDGYSIRLMANLEMVEEIDLVQRFGGEGVGLFRSEYIFLPKAEIPSEEDQFKTYRKLIQGLKGLPIVIRTFDLGGDKIAQPTDTSYFLGCRATRFLLRDEELFKNQLRAIMRASVFGNVSLLFPMISTVTELRDAKRMLAEVCQELNMPLTMKVGCMIEVPSAALIIEHFAKECDFLSIGTNDLVQYSLAVDRRDQILSEFYEPSEPSVIRMMHLIVKEANKARIPVSVCGEMASDPRFTPLLLGIGVQELSAAPRYLPAVKNAIRRTSIVDAIHLAEQALNLKTSKEVMELLNGEYKKNVPDDLFYNA